MSIALHNKDVKLLPPDTFLIPQNAQKCVEGLGSAPDPAGGAYSAPPDPLAGKGGGPPGKGEGGERRGGVGRGGKRDGKGKGYPPNGNPGYGPASRMAGLAYS